MARKLILQNLMKLAQSIGANPKNFMGTRTNITFLGKGPQRNPLFQSPVAGLETASEASLGPRESIIGAVEDAMGFASANKLNDIQLKALTLNLENIHKVYNPPPSNVTSMMDAFVRKQMGIAGLRKFPKETHKFMGRPLKSKDFSEIDRMVMEGKIPDARGRKWNLKVPETGPGAYTAVLDQKTGMSRAIARQILQQDTRLKLPKEVLISLRTGSRGPDPLDLMKKYYGESMLKYDEFLNNFPFIKYPDPEQIATRVLSEVELIPAFAHGGLARILEV